MHGQTAAARAASAAERLGSQCLIEWRIEGQFDVQNTKFTMLFNSILGNKYAG
jgi:hypothetical protein